MSVRGTRDDGSASIRTSELGTTARGAAVIRNAQAPGAARRAFVAPRLTRHEPLTRITLVSGMDFGGSGGSGGTFFGS